MEDGKPLSNPLKKEQVQKEARVQDLSDLSTPVIIAPVVASWWSTVGFRLFLWSAFLVAIITLGYLFRSRFSSQIPPSLLFISTPVPTSVTSPTPAAVGVSRLVAAAALPMSATSFLPEPTITGGGRIRHLIPTPPPGGAVIAVTPKEQMTGWVSSLDGRSHFDEPNIHAGFFNGHVYYGTIQFDLSAVPPASRLTYAALELAGLGDQNLNPGGMWQINMLDPAIDDIWPVLTYNHLHAAGVQISVGPGVTSAGLSRDKVNVFLFGSEQLAALQQRLANGLVSFRIAGPTSGGDNLFTWDSGSEGVKKLQERQLQGPAFTDEVFIIQSRQPVLWLVTERSEYVVITATPTPENIFTVAAIAATATANATKTGTPLPAAWATPIVVTVPPPPANAATATYQVQVVTAEAIAFGTASPTPLNVWTATPTPHKIFVTSTPTPQNAVTLAAIAARATIVAQNVGTYTPVPQEWTTPFVVTPRPAPRNAATAEFYIQEVTAEAFLYGMIWTATPTPLFASPSLVGTYTPTPGYEPVPSLLVNKIAFLSDRAGSQEETGLEPMVYVMDPDGSNVTLLSNRAVYDTALARDSFSADQRFRAYVADFLRFDGTQVPGIYFQDYHYNATEQVTQFGAGIAWDPTWSPTGEQIAFVSNETKNDEIWIINRNGSGLLQLTTGNEAYNAQRIGKDDFFPEVNRHPSWSPNTGNAQIWIMDPDGSHQRIINHNPHNDWNPVWIKYVDSPPLLSEPTTMRQNPFDLYE
jgi:hypothetical protein